MTTKEYWKQIRAIAAGLDPEALARDRAEEDESERTHLRTSQQPVWLMSVRNDEKGSVAGSVVLMRPYPAAERIFAQTHRAATAQEIAVEEKRRDDLKVQIEEEERSRKGNHARDIGDAIASSILAGQAAQQQQKPPRRGAEPAG